NGIRNHRISGVSFCTLPGSGIGTTIKVTVITALLFNYF
ncbi:MAG: hypothetical protein ACI8VI_000631, partial [Granulosicoccus sp.]